MGIFKKVSLSVVVLCLILGTISLVAVFAAVTPSLGIASTFGILSSTYTNTVGGTTINGDLGYTTGPAVAPTVNGTTYIADGIYNQAGTDQGTALTSLNNQACTFTFPSGAVDLATDTTHGTVGVYTPGVYCTTGAGAANIGTGGITLNGSGTYIFRINGALSTTTGSVVSLSGGASACDVFWTPTSATTLAANTTFVGTNIDDSGITIGSTVSLTGRALAFGGTVSTDVDTITAPTCTVPTATPSSVVQQATINVVKVVVNDNGGTKTVADFPLFVNGTKVVSGETNTFRAPGPVYTVTETGNANYTQSFSGDCDVNGQVDLNPGDNKFCILTNDDIGAVVVPPVPPLIDVVKVPSPLALPNGPGPVTYTYRLSNPGTVPLSDVRLTDDKCASANYLSGDTNTNGKLDPTETWTYACRTNLTKTTTNTAIATGTANGLTARDLAVATVVVATPKLPNTGYPPEQGSIPEMVAVLVGILAVSGSFIARAKGVI